MTIYYIDNNRGDDANSGLSKDLAWKNLAKLVDTVNFAPGDVINLEGESVFTRGATLAEAQTAWVYWTGADKRKMSGSAAGIITLQGYNYNSGDSQKPTISSIYDSAPADWTYDPTYGCWYVPSGAAGPSLAGTLMLFGDSEVFGQRSGDSTGAPSACTYDYAYLPHAGTKRLYVYSPVGINPVAYYGKVQFSMYTGGVFACWNQYRYTTMRNMRFSKCGPIIVGWYGDTWTNGGLVNAVWEDCEVDHCGGFVALQTAYTPGVGGAVPVGGVEIRDNLCTYNAGPLITAGGGNSCSSRGIRIHHNRFTDFNFSASNGAIYFQQNSFVGERDGVVVEQNYFARARYNSGGYASDGCAIYFEVGGNCGEVSRNLIEDCQVAIQSNCGAIVDVFGNVINDCAMALSVADQGGVGTTDVRFHHNTCFNMKPDSSKYAVRTNNSFGKQAAVYYWGGVSPDNGQGNTFNVSVYNNIFHTVDNPTVKPACAIGNASPILIGQNAYFGYAGYKRTGGTDVTPLGQAVTADPQLNSDYSLKPTSPCLGAGKALDIPTTDFNGRAFGTPPDIGAVRFVRRFDRAQR